MPHRGYEFLFPYSGFTTSSLPLCLALFYKMQYHFLCPSLGWKDQAGFLTLGLRDPSCGPDSALTVVFGW